MCMPNWQVFNVENRRKIDIAQYLRHATLHAHMTTKQKQQIERQEALEILDHLKALVHAGGCDHCKANFEKDRKKLLKTIRHTSFHNCDDLTIQFNRLNPNDESTLAVSEYHAEGTAVTVFIAGRELYDYHSGNQDRR
jgi:hypothetical protein